DEWHHASRPSFNHARGASHWTVRARDSLDSLSIARIHPWRLGVDCIGCSDLVLDSSNPLEYGISDNPLFSWQDARAAKHNSRPKAGFSESESPQVVTGSRSRMPGHRRHLVCST